MTFTNILKAFGFFNNGPPAEPSYNDAKHGSTPSASRAYYAAADPPIVNGYPVNNSYAPPAPAPPYYDYPRQPAPANLAHPIPWNGGEHDHESTYNSKGLKFKPGLDELPPPSSEFQPAAMAESEYASHVETKIPKGDKVGEKNGKRKKGTGKNRSGRSSGDSFKIYGNTINGNKGDKVGVFDFGNKYSNGRKKRDEESTDEESDSSSDEDERDDN